MKGKIIRKKNESSSFNIDPGTAPMKEVLGLFLAISDLNYLIEKKPLEIRINNYETGSFDFLEGMNLGTKYTTRKETYDAIEKYCPENRIRELKNKIDFRFPKTEFEDSLPYHSVFNLLVNDPEVIENREYRKLI